MNRPAFPIELTPAELRVVIHALQARVEILKTKMVELPAGCPGWRALRDYVRVDLELARKLGEILKTVV